jgi:hypothetical protein
MQIDKNGQKHEHSKLHASEASAWVQHQTPRGIWVSKDAHFMLNATKIQKMVNR